MKNIKTAVKNFLAKHGAIIASCAFAVVAISANSSCCLPYYEPEEPKGLDSFKKYNK